MKTDHPTQRLLVLTLLTISALTTFAQSDNFDSGTLSSAWTKYQFFGQSYTFPAAGTGKALRIQANPAPVCPGRCCYRPNQPIHGFLCSRRCGQFCRGEDQAAVLFGDGRPGGTGAWRADGHDCQL